MSLWRANLGQRGTSFAVLVLFTATLIAPILTAPSTTSAAPTAAQCKTLQDEAVASGGVASAALRALDSKWKGLDREAMATFYLAVFNRDFNPSKDGWFTTFWGTVSGAVFTSVDNMIAWSETPLRTAAWLVGIDIAPFGTEVGSKIKTNLGGVKANFENQAGLTRAKLATHQQKLIALGQSGCGDAGKATFDQQYRTLKALADESQSPLAYNTYVGKSWYGFSLNVTKFDLVPMTYENLASGKADCSVLKATFADQLSNTKSAVANTKSTYFEEERGIFRAKNNDIDAAKTAVTTAQEGWKKANDTLTKLKDNNLKDEAGKPCLSAEEKTQYDEELKALGDEINTLGDRVDLKMDSIQYKAETKIDAYLKECSGGSGEWWNLAGKFVEVACAMGLAVFEGVGKLLGQLATEVEKAYREW
ncbi:MAG: hypothetical protein ACOYBJ_01740 [Patescibacteria group bacterium]|jgi:hypothetical protein